MEHYDVIIIGTGAGGGTLAHRLAPTGKRILLLERGGYLPREPVRERAAAGPRADDDHVVVLAHEIGLLRRGRSVRSRRRSRRAAWDG